MKGKLKLTEYDFKKKKKGKQNPTKQNHILFYRGLSEDQSCNSFAFVHQFWFYLGKYGNFRTPLPWGP